MEAQDASFQQFQAITPNSGSVVGAVLDDDDLMPNCRETGEAEASDKESTAQYMRNDPQSWLAERPRSEVPLLAGSSPFLGSSSGGDSGACYTSACKNNVSKRCTP